jgi:hypothetical protein
MSLLDDVSIVVTPNGYKAGELYAVIPVPTLGAEMLSQPVDLVTDFIVNGGGVIVDADTFTTAGGTFDGIRINSFFTIGTRYKLIIDGDTTSSGFTIGETTLSGNEYGSGFGTHYFTAIGTGSLWIRQQTSGTTNITSFSIKEYTSADMDVTRNTAATRVDENGLVNYAEVIGGEEVTDGNFPSGTTAWSFGGGWSLGVGVAEADGSTSTSNLLTQDLGLVATKTYTISFSSNRVGGTLFVKNGTSHLSTTIYTLNTGTGLEVQTFTVTSPSSSAIGFYAYNYEGTIDNVTVKEYAAMPLDV